MFRSDPDTTVSDQPTQIRIHNPLKSTAWFLPLLFVLSVICEVQIVASTFSIRSLYICISSIIIAYHNTFYHVLISVIKGSRKKNFFQWPGPEGGEGLATNGLNGRASKKNIFLRLPQLTVRRIKIKIGKVKKTLNKT